MTTATATTATTALSLNQMSPNTAGMAPSATSPMDTAAIGTTDAGRLARPTSSTSLSTACARCTAVTMRSSPDHGCPSPSRIPTRRRLRASVVRERAACSIQPPAQASAKRWVAIPTPRDSGASASVVSRVGRSIVGGPSGGGFATARSPLSRTRSCHSMA